MPYHGEWSWAHIRNILNSNGREWAAEGPNIQEAIDDLPAGGGRVWLPYAPVADPLRITAPIDVVDGLNLVGIGRSSTTIYLENDSDCDMIRYVGAENLYDLLIENIMFNGNRTNQVAGHGLNIDTVGGGSVSDSKISRCAFNQMWDDGVHIETCWGWTIEDTWAENCNQNGFAFEGGSGPTCYRLKAGYCGDAGLRIWGSTYSRILGLESFENDNQGVMLGAGTDHTVLSASHIWDNSQGGVGAADNIWVQGDCCLLDDLSIIGLAQARWGINIQASADDTRINQCHISGHTVGTIQDLGARTRINGHGREAVGAPGAPVAANWDVGDIVRNTFDNTQWIKDYDGVMRQIA